jgi:hypothetical protein
MRITLEPTTRLVEIGGGITARVWQGTSDAGIECYCLITRVAVHRDADQHDFEAALTEQMPPSFNAIEAFPLRLIL